jgi:hypothetical protein
MPAETPERPGNAPQRRAPRRTKAADGERAARAAGAVLERMIELSLYAEEKLKSG